MRKRWVEKIVSSPAAWVVPFVLQLLGEYVIEIIKLLESNSDALKQDCYREFNNDNPEFAELICARIVSYWNCYFRGETPHFIEHAAYRVARDIGLWRQPLSRRLRR